MTPNTHSFTFTVFTPSFNRAHSLPRVYEALCSQTYRDFEWLIIDDGSTDGTEKLVLKWQHEADFHICYVWQENSGKHIAVNRGVQEARGRFFLFLDSDDTCVPNALERLKYHWDAIPADKKESFSAVSSLAQDLEGNIIGRRFPSDPTDSDSLEIRLKYKVTGEKWGFHRTDILRMFPNPKFGTENYLPESLLWHRIAVRFKTRYINEPLEIYHPAPDGWGKNSIKIRAKNPLGSRFFYKEYVSLDYPIPRKKRLREYANYVRYSLHAKIGIRQQIAEIPSAVNFWLAWPVGLAAYLRDRRMLASG